jgi:hypothetical protein
MLTFEEIIKLPKTFCPISNQYEYYNEEENIWYSMDGNRIGSGIKYFKGETIKYKN